MAFQRSDWPAFEEQALQQLQSPREHLVLRFWRYPAFEAFTSWQLTNAWRSPSGYEGSPPRLWQDTWDRPLDFAMVSDPLEGLRRGHRAQPTLESRTFTLAEQDLEQILHGLGKIQIPLVLPWGIAVDGIGYGLEAPGHFRVCWNDHALPVDWQPLHDWMDETLLGLGRNLF